ncbi:hypothetical protein KA977_09290, partial [Candidatus Dependentiae bacterium]|nr:hypothetical protein [Candidatus Dependentiae bacterium]
TETQNIYSRLNSLTSDTQNIKTDLSSFKSQVYTETQNIYSRLDSLTSDTQNIKTDLSNFKSQVYTETQNIYSRLNSLTSDTQNIKTDLSSFKSQVYTETQNIYSRLNSLTTDTQTLKTDLLNFRSTLYSETTNLYNQLSNIRSDSISGLALTKITGDSVTKTYVDSQLANKSDTPHYHLISNIQDSIPYSRLSGTPAAIDTSSYVANAILNDSFNIKANLSSPTFTGTITADSLIISNTGLVAAKTGNIGIGTNSPSMPVDILKTSGGGILRIIGHNVTASQGIIMVENFTSSALYGAGIQLGRAGGTSSAPTAVASGDVLGGLYGKGYTGSAWSSNNITAIRMVAEENFSLTNQGAKIDFATTNTGETTRTIRMTISGNGYVGIGTTSPDKNLHIVGALKLASTSSADTAILYFGSNRFLWNSNMRGTFTGNNAGSLNVSANDNSGFGYNSLSSITSGYGNTALGSYSMQATSTGGYNAAAGAYSMNSNTTGSYNTAMGLEALSQNTSGNNNSAFGYNSGYKTTGSNNSHFGYQAGYNATSGLNNVVIGYQAGYNMTTGSGNIFLGKHAGYNETGSNRLYIHNSNSDSTAALIYGEFDNTKIIFNANTGIKKTNPGSELDVKGTLRLSGSTSGYVGIAPAAAAGSTTYTLPSADGSNGQVLATNGAGTLSWTSASSSQWTTSGSNIYYTTGSVGIGTTNPTGYPLYVVASSYDMVRLQGAGNQNIYIRAKNTDSTNNNGFMLIGENSSGLNSAYLQLVNVLHGGAGSQQGAIVFHTANNDYPAERFRVNPNGNVGIGTSTPSDSLTVYGTLNVKSRHTGDTPAIVTDMYGNVGLGGAPHTSKMHIIGNVAEAAIETQEVLRMSRQPRSGVKNANSFGIALGSFETGVNGRSRVDFMLAGQDAGSNNYGWLPNVT